MKKRIGLLLIVIGALHSMLGFFKFKDNFWTMFNQGFVNSAGTVPGKLAFWFTLAGFLFIFLGYLMNFLERQGTSLPGGLGWMLLGTALTGVILLPVSGFWLIFLPAMLILLGARKNRGVASQ